jgi:tRNA (guanine-N7-)-methyltransferase
MPNIQTKEFNHPSYPFEKDGYEFKFATKFNKNKSLIMIKKDTKEFFIEVIKREDDFLIKAEKLTRFSPVYIIQDALKALKEYQNLQLTYSNIQSKKSKQLLKKDDEYLKKIDFFIDKFHHDKPIVIEIGFGSGRHLLKRALEDKNTIHIGIEIHKPSIEQVIKQCQLQNIKNLLILDYDARIFLELLKSQTVKTIYLHFPVPWDKKPHRRVISYNFIKECKRVLIKNGTFELRTDSENYYNYSFEVFNNFKDFSLQIRKNHSLDITSKYEDRWLKQEKNIYDLIMTNTNPSKEEKQEYNINFDDDFFNSFEKFKDLFQRECLREKECFVNLEALYTISQTEGMLKVTLGSYDKSEHKYILFKDKKVKYIPSKPIPVKSNQNSHDLLVGYIKKKVENVC